MNSSIFCHVEKCTQSEFWKIFTWEFIRYWASSGVATRHFSGEVPKMQNLSKMISSGCFVCFSLVNGAKHSLLIFRLMVPEGWFLQVNVDLKPKRSPLWSLLPNLVSWGVHCNQIGPFSRLSYSWGALRECSITFDVSFNPIGSAPPFHYPPRPENRAWVFRHWGKCIASNFLPRFHIVFKLYV